jgi:hypothetical protein
MPRTPASTSEGRPRGAPVTLTVSPTDIPTWSGHGRRSVLVVSGKLTGRDWPKLSRITATTVDTGVDRIVLDVWAVVSCDRVALLALAAVRGRHPARPACVVDVVGIRRAQFVEALAREPQAGRPALEAVIAELRRPPIVPPLPRHGASTPDAPPDRPHPAPRLRDHLPHDPAQRDRGRA